MQAVKQNRFIKKTKIFVIIAIVLTLIAAITAGTVYYLNDAKNPVIKSTDDADDSVNILLVFHDELSKNIIFSVVRFDDKDKIIKTAAFDEKTVLNGKSLKNHYSYKGILEVCGAFLTQTETKIDKIVSLSLSSVSEIVDMFGGIVYNIEKDIEYSENGRVLTRLHAGEQTLNGVGTAMYLRCRNWGEAENKTDETGDRNSELILAFFKQYTTEADLSKLETRFSKMVNLFDGNTTLGTSDIKRLSTELLSFVNDVNMGKTVKIKTDNNFNLTDETITEIKNNFK